MIKGELVEMKANQSQPGSKMASGVSNARHLQNALGVVPQHDVTTLANVVNEAFMDTFRHHFEEPDRILQQYTSNNKTVNSIKMKMRKLQQAEVSLKSF